MAKKRFLNKRSIWKAWIDRSVTSESVIHVLIDKGEEDVNK